MLCIYVLMCICSVRMNAFTLYITYVVTHEILHLDNKENARMRLWVCFEIYKLLTYFRMYFIDNMLLMQSYNE
jgi:hypothetical protein